MLLTIYVDDLLLSGPEQYHDKFWRELRRHVDIEDPEDLDRYLGRHHLIEKAARLPDNVMTYFDSAMND